MNRPVRRYIELFGGQEDGEVISFGIDEPSPTVYEAANGDRYVLRVTLSGNANLGTYAAFHYYELQTDEA